jgi:hypothetical protein
MFRFSLRRAVVGAALMAAAATAAEPRPGLATGAWKLESLRLHDGRRLDGLVIEPLDSGGHRDPTAPIVVGRQPRVPRYSVCVECKERGTVCVAVAHGIACLGPATQAGCGAICPAHGRECFGCYGPDEQPNLVSLTGFYERRGTPRPHLSRLVRSFNAWSPDFRRESDRLEHDPAGGPP